jgi:methyl coenzyme M reductase subunit D
VGKIQKHKFNLYYAYFDDPDASNLREYELKGVNEDNIRKAYEICAQYSPCQFKLDYEGKVLKHQCALVLNAKVEESKKLAELKEKLIEAQIFCKSMKVSTNEKGFRCSI